MRQCPTPNRPPVRSNPAAFLSRDVALSLRERSAAASHAESATSTPQRDRPLSSRGTRWLHREGQQWAKYWLPAARQARNNNTRVRKRSVPRRLDAGGGIDFLMI